MGRLKKTLQECRTKEDYTFYWFLNGWKEERIPEMFVQIPFCEDIAKACEVAAFSKDKYDSYQSDKRTKRDIAYFNEVRYEEGREEGRKEGREVGREEERLSLAKNFKSLGVSVEQIAKATGLTEAEIVQM